MAAKRILRGMKSGADFDRVVNHTDGTPTQTIHSVNVGLPVPIIVVEMVGQEIGAELAAKLATEQRPKVDQAGQPGGVVGRVAAPITTDATPSQAGG